MSGSLVGQSQTVMLEDCFNFSQGPGCGFSGGDATDIQFDFSSLALNAGSTYFFEIIDVNSTLGVGYYTGGGYGEGDAYFFGMSSTDDLWFRVGHIANVPEPAGLALLSSGMVLLAARRKRADPLF